MSGLLASMIAGGAKGVADTRLKDIEQQEEFDMRQRLMDAEVEKQLRLKEAGYQMEQQHAQAERDRVGGLLQEGREATKPEGEPGGYDPNTKTYEDMSEYEQMLFDAQTLKKSGDLEGYDKMIARAKNVMPTNSFDPIELDDGTVLSFSKNSGNIEVAYQGSGKKGYDTIEEAIVNEADPRKRAELINVKKEIAAAGRAPNKPSDEDETYADWKRKPENANKGRDDFAREQATWGKEDIETTSTTEERDPDGELISTRKTTTSKGKPKPKQDAPKKPWERSW